jgi:hypothetical protein
MGLLSVPHIRVSESRRRLHDADAPVQKEYSGPRGGPIPIAVSAVNYAEILEIIEANEREDSL